MIQEIKKIGLKINSLARKIEEADKAGMTTRIPGYVDEISKSCKKLDSCFETLRKEYPSNEE